ncbi:hypothetical protein CCACVL1_20328 [Corchorus capsularis]|uniref:Uncharacterized protein n=1 Tax=Corchorus capsularis TaxID=210143 RepID=A0A1R3HBN9_COCAP|nr:hypothetical protein CCACVL1_20328 [Corchorus capsularis]
MSSAVTAGVAWVGGGVGTIGSSVDWGLKQRR